MFAGLPGHQGHRGACALTPLTRAHKSTIRHVGPLGHLGDRERKKKNVLDSLKGVETKIAYLNLYGLALGPDRVLQTKKGPVVGSSDVPSTARPTATHSPRVCSKGVQRARRGGGRRPGEDPCGCALFLTYTVSFRDKLRLCLAQSGAALNG